MSTAMNLTWAQVQKKLWVSVLFLLFGLIAVVSVSSKVDVWLGFVAGFLLFAADVVLIAVLCRLVFARVPDVSGQQPMQRAVHPAALGLLGFFKVFGLLGMLYLCLVVWQLNALSLVFGCLLALSSFIFVGLLVYLQPAR